MSPRHLDFSAGNNPQGTASIAVVLLARSRRPRRPITLIGVAVMAETMHPSASHHLPGFITSPGETDVLFTGSTIFIIIMVLVIGSLYFWLHALPERIAVIGESYWQVAPSFAGGKA
jgi:hypothetical protein